MGPKGRSCVQFSGASRICVAISSVGFGSRSGELVRKPYPVPKREVGCQTTPRKGDLHVSSVAPRNPWVERPAKEGGSPHVQLLRLCRDQAHDGRATENIANAGGNQPFGLMLAMRFLYLGSQHRGALAALNQGTELNRGFLDTGIVRPGLGRMSLIFRWLEGLREKRRKVFLFHADSDSYELMR